MYDALDRPARTRAPCPRCTRALDERGRRRARARRPAPARRRWCRWRWPGCSSGGPARRVVVAEPRRIAARAAARRMAWLLGEQAGGRASASPCAASGVVGRAHASWRSSPPVCCCSGCSATRSWPGVDVVVLDECHERHLDADTAAAFLLDVRAALRPELRLVAASATTDARGLGAAARADAPVVRGARASSHPVEVVWAPPAAPGAAAARDAGRPGAADACGVGGAAGAGRAARGTCCASCPASARSRGWRGSWAGVGTRRCSRCTGGRRPPCRTRCCAGGPAAAPGGAGDLGGRVVADRAGVRVVVDSGLAREPRIDHARGLSALTTVRASQAAAAAAGGPGRA